MPTFSREEWLTERRKHIGGSDAPKVMGVSKYGSAFDVYMSIVEGVRPDTTDAMKRGQELEPLVIYLYQQQTGHETVPGAFLVSSEHDFMAATLDLVDATEGCNVQCKTSSTWTRDKWGDPRDEDYLIPGDYMIQVQHEMAVCGAGETVIPVLFAAEEGFKALRAMLKVRVPMDIVAQQALELGELQIFPVKRNDTLIAQMIEDEKTFWEEHVLTKTPPFNPAAPQATTTIREPDDAEMALLEAARPVYRALKLADARWKEHKAGLSKAIGEDSGLAVPDGGKVTYKAPAPKVTKTVTVEWEAIAKWCSVFAGIPDDKWNAKVEEFTTEEITTTQGARRLLVPRPWGKE